jgi:hypothetical protein
MRIEEELDELDELNEFTILQGTWIKNHVTSKYLVPYLCCPKARQEETKFWIKQKPSFNISSRQASNFLNLPSYYSYYNNPHACRPDDYRDYLKGLQIEARG